MTESEAHERVTARVALLEATFREIACTRMAGVPIARPDLRVQAVDFQLAPGNVASGVLITPWFMNLVRLPLTRMAGTHSIGRKQAHDIGRHGIEFTWAHEEAIGAFEVSSLFSPMFELADQSSAVAVAHEVVAQLHGSPSAGVGPGSSAVATAPHATLGRRGFLLGRAGHGAGR